MPNERIHFIGIGGSAIAPLAVMIKNLGIEVTGSDTNVFDPALTLLKENNILWTEGFKAENVNGASLVILGGAGLMKDSNNPEYLEAQKLNIPVQSYTFLIQKYIVKPESIVIAGTYGKTTISSLVAWVLTTAQKDPSFLIGGLPKNFDSGINYSNTNISVCEGDEFAASFGFDMTPKFMYYKPKYTIISAAQWDHLNMYPTEQTYIQAYKDLIDLTYKNGGRVYISKTGKNNDILIDHTKGKAITYSIEENISNIEFKEYKTSFTINGLGEFYTTQIGLHNVENCLSAILLATDLGINKETIQKALSTFTGVKRRLEIVGNTKNNSTVIDDFAHSPIKAQSTLEALRTRYKDKKIIAVYSPRVSERESKDVLKWYEKTFKEADTIIIPRITVKKSTPKDMRIHGIDLLNAIDHDSKYYFPKEEQIKDYIEKNSDENTIIIFMSAGGWGNLITDLIV